MRHRWSERCGEKELINFSFFVITEMVTLRRIEEVGSNMCVGYAVDIWNRPSS